MSTHFWAETNRAPPSWNKELLRHASLFNWPSRMPLIGGPLMPCTVWNVTLFVFHSFLLPYHVSALFHYHSLSHCSASLSFNHPCRPVTSDIQPCVQPLRLSARPCPEHTMHCVLSCYTEQFVQMTDNHESQLHQYITLHRVASDAGGGSVTGLVARLIECRGCRRRQGVWRKKHKTLICDYLSFLKNKQKTKHRSCQANDC